MKGHVAFVAVPKVRRDVFRPLVRLGQEHAVAVFPIDLGSQLPEKLVRLG